MSTGTLFAALESIPDHRTKKGRRFPLAAILAISIAAMLSGANDLMTIFRWGRRLSPKALQALGVDKKRRKAPCHATYHYVFQAISAEDLARALGHLVAADGGLGHVAIDGKRLRGSQRETSPGVHMLNAFSTKLQAAVGSLVVPPDSGEVIRGAGADQVAAAGRSGRYGRCGLHLQARRRGNPQKGRRLLPVRQGQPART